MRHFKEHADRMNTKYAAEICGNVVQNCLKPTVPHLVPQGSGHMDGASLLVTNQMVEVTKPNRNR